MLAFSAGYGTMEKTWGGDSMTLGNKLTKLRRENNYTQEQLAEILGVSRQAISKWESDAAYPETEKLIRLGRLYKCSMGYLLLDENEEQRQKETSKSDGVSSLNISRFCFERISKRKVGNLPLWHINIGFGRVAKGIFAIGFAAKGVVSVGLASVGVISFGILAVGLLAVGSLAAGVLAAGAISVGILALGAIAVGIFGMGALAIGQFAVGAAAFGHYAAFGDTATAAIAIGRSEAYGSSFQLLLEEMTRQEFSQIWNLLNQRVPQYLEIFKRLFLFLMG